MRSQQIIPLLASALASALLAALVATLLFTIPTLAQIEEPWNIVVVSEALTFARLTFIVALAHALILGLPLFFFLHSIYRLGIASCVLLCSWFYWIVRPRWRLNLLGRHARIRPIGWRAERN